MPRLQRLLGGAPLARLRSRLRRRYEQGREGGVVTLGGLDPTERTALCGVLGRPAGEGTSLRFDIAELDAVLRGSGLAASLRDALELLDGPIDQRAARRDEAALAWSSLLATVAEPRLAAWLAQPRALGAVKRACGGDVAHAARLCADAAAVLRILPCAPMTRSHLAAQVLGDAHALDNGRPVAMLVLAVLRHQRTDELDQAGQDEPVRAQWAAAGILVNELARPVLVLNLPGLDVEAGEPAYLSLRTLLRKARPWAVAQRQVFVCENPNVVAIAADALGAACAPLVCTDGMPAAAQRTLLLQLAGAGARLAYHGDFDWPGIGIGNTVMQDFGASPWRFCAQDYREALLVAAAADRRLDPTARQACWDRDLAPLMGMERIPIDEEAVAALLLEDLRG